MYDCFVMSNMAPQAHALNSGAWQTLEDCERRWVKRDSAIVIVAGPLYYETDTQRIGREDGPRVPSAFFKVLAAPYLEEPRAIAFVYPNMTAPGNMAQYSMSVRELEKMTGYNFFAEMPNAIEDAMETVASFKEWNR